MESINWAPALAHCSKQTDGTRGAWSSTSALRSASAKIQTREARSAYSELFRGTHRAWVLFGSEVWLALGPRPETLFSRRLHPRRMLRIAAQSRQGLDSTPRSMLSSYGVVAASVATGRGSNELPSVREIPVRTSTSTPRHSVRSPAPGGASPRRS
jgi:hypothetical protein